MQQHILGTDTMLGLLIPGLIVVFLVVFLVVGIVKLSRSQSSRGVGGVVFGVGILAVVAWVGIVYVRTSVRVRDVSEVRQSNAVSNVFSSGDAAVESSSPTALRPPEVGSPPILTANGAYAYHLEDAFEVWKRKCFKADFEEFTVVAEKEGVPSWVLDASGTTWRSQYVPGRVSVRSRFPGERGRLAGYSDALYEDQAIAKDSAFRTVASTLTAAVLWELRDRTPPANADDFHEAMRLARTEIYNRQGDLERASIARSVPIGAAGTMYWAALEIDASESTVGSIARLVRDELVRQTQVRVVSHRTFVTNIVSALGLALCTFLIYCFLNAGTKGHFAWPLRIISIGALLAIFALALLA